MRSPAALLPQQAHQHQHQHQHLQHQLQHHQLEQQQQHRGGAERRFFQQPTLYHHRGQQHQHQHQQEEVTDAVVADDDVGSLSPEACWGAQLLADDDDDDAGGPPLTEDDRNLVQFVQRQQTSADVDLAKGGDADAANPLLGNLIRLFNHPFNVDQDELPADLESSLRPLPLPSLKHASNTLWYHQRSHRNVDDDPRNSESEDADPSPVQNRQQLKKSLPHKKRISRKLKKTPQNGCHASADRELVDDRPVVDIIQQNDVVHSSVEHHSLSDVNLHVGRGIFICQLCGDFYGDDQLKFFYHLKHHYEPQTTMMLDNMQHDPNSIVLDKIDGSMVVTNEPLPDSLADLSLDDAVSEKSLLYQEQNKISDYEETAKSMYNVTLKQSMYTTEEKQMHHEEAAKFNYIDEGPSEKMFYACAMCPKTFRRQKQYEGHTKDCHSKVEEISEFSEPEDMMEGIHVVVDADNEEYVQDDLSSQNSNSMVIQTGVDNQDQYILPHLTIENGQVVPETNMDSKQWFVKTSGTSESAKNKDADPESAHDKGSSLPADSSKFDQFSKSEELIVCPICGGTVPNKKAFELHAIQYHMDLKEDVMQRIMDSTVVDASDVDAAGQTNPFDEVDLDEESDGVEELEDTPEAPDGKSHERNPKKTVYPCNFCGKEYSSRHSIVQHMSTHEEAKLFACETCKKTFFTASALKIHVRLHNGDKPFKCVECGRMFRQWGDLKYHYISIHSDVKQHQCEYCGKNFARKYSLIIHRRIHTGEKNYRCEFCDKTFRASSYLQNHRKIHTGERPYPCEQCGRRFRMRGDMRRHLRIHKKAPPGKGGKAEDSATDVAAKKAAVAPKSLVVVAKREPKTERDADNSSSSNGGSGDPGDPRMTSRDADPRMSVDLARMTTVDLAKVAVAAGYQIDNGGGGVSMWPIFIT